MAVRDLRRRERPESGASAVEFALVMPVLVLLISGIIGFGIVFAQQIALGNAARQAARSAAVNGPTCGNLIDQARVDATTIAVTPGSVGVAVKRSAATPTDWTTSLCTTNDATTGKVCKSSAVGDNVYVRLSYTSTLALPFFQPSFNLKGIGAFRCEFS